jgi:purine-nucleoside phosphorylase
VQPLNKEKIMATPHINAKDNAFAETVLLPGDPLRAKFIAETFLKNATQVTDVRNMLGFTGEYEGKKVSVMGSGMGIPSCSIYAKELITEYGVKNIIRIGSAGGLAGTKLRDVVIANGASTDSTVNRQRLAGFDYSATANFELTLKAYNAAKENGIDVKVGQCFSADLFYTPNFEAFALMEKMKILCVEMEAAGLYGVCAEFGANALALLTISDHIRTGEALHSADRQTTFTDMMKIALNCI